MRFYISFGQAHTHSIDGQTYDKDCLLAIEAKDELQARLGVNKMLNGKWCGIYNEMDLERHGHYFPHGVRNMDRPVQIFTDDQQLPPR